jgi:UrcA family protein
MMHFLKASAATLATLTVGLALTLADTSVADAAPAQQSSIAVSYADLNLNTPAGMAIMRARIDQAAREVCGQEPGLRDMTGHALYLSCIKTATNLAIASLPSNIALNGDTRNAQQNR